MKASPTYAARERIAKLAYDLFAELRELDTPRDAANCLALVHAHLLFSQTPDGARLKGMLEEMTKASEENFRVLSQTVPHS